MAMNWLGKNLSWFKIGLLVVFVVFVYILWLSFVQAPKERAAVKYMADLTLQKCLSDVSTLESRISPADTLYQSEEQSMQQMRTDCQNNYHLHLDQGYSQI